MSIAQSPARRKLNRTAPQPMRLEPRLMFDGAAVDTAVDSFTAPAATGTDTPYTGAADITPAQSALPVALAPSTPPSRQEIVFLDTSLPNWAILAEGMKDGIELVLLDSTRDGFQQIGEALAGRTAIDALHIVSHGAQGMVRLGNSQLDAVTLDERGATVSAWGQHLADDADILLYGCDVAASAGGQQLLDRLGQLTGADVAASTDATGGSTAGGDWHLEYASGAIQAGTFLTLQGMNDYQARLSTVSLGVSSGWTAIMYGTGKDPDGDSQAGAADTDIIGDASHGSLYTAFDDNGTPNNDADDSLAFRMRIDNPTSTSYFGGVAIVGMDANQDGRIDIFMSVDGRNNTQAVRLLDPGTGANLSPSTTTTNPLPTGWLPNNGIYPFGNSAIYQVVAVTATSDPHWGLPSVAVAGSSASDLTGDGHTDAFVNWKVPIADLATVLAKPSPVDRSGVYGPRGATGIQGFGKNTVVSYVNFTQTQPGPINGDLNGVGASYDKNATFASLGVFTAPMSASNPVSASLYVAITGPMDWNGNSDATLNATEDNTVVIKGTTATGVTNGSWVKVTVTDGTTTNTYYTQVTSNAWSVASQDLSGLNDTTLTASAELWTTGDGTGSKVVGSTGDTATVLHDKTAPTIGINQLASAVSGTPTLTGTSNLPDGSIVQVTLDPDNNPATANVTYQVMVSGGVWSLNTATVAPASGSLPSGGLTSHTKITATATDAAGNSATATALNRPTVNTLTTNDTTPVITGTWTKVDGDTLTVTVSGATYTLTPSGNTWSLDLGTAIPGSGSLTALTASASPGNPYEVLATVTRSGSVSDTTSTELHIINTPVVSVGINDDATGDGVNDDGTNDDTTNTTDTTPVLSGTSQNAGGYVIVRLDPGNDGNLSDAVTYSVTPDGSGNWQLDTGTAQPISGQKPSGGYVGNVGVHASDSTGTVSDSQVLVVTTPSIAISAITSTATADAFGQISNAGAGANWLNMTEDNAVTITGTATGATTVDLTITDANGHYLTYTGISVSGGTWSKTGLDLSSLDNGVLTITATISGTNVSASNTTVTHDKLAPSIFNTTPSEITKKASVSGGSELHSIGLTINAGGQTLTATTDATTGDWVSSVPASNLVSGSAGTILVTVGPTATATDDAGNIVQSVSWNQYVAANASGNTISINTIATDNTITSNEIASGITISGTTTLTGTPLITLSVTDGTTTVNPTAVNASSGAWTTTLSLADIKTLANGLLTVTATAPDGTVTIKDVAMPVLSLPSPTLTITDDVTNTATGDVTFTFTFSEAVTGFTQGDISISGGTAVSSLSGSGSTYTLVVTPTTPGSGDIVVSVGNSVATATATGRNNVGASDTQPFDTTGAAAAPTVSIDVDNLATDSTPVISGTTSLSPGAPIVVNIDTDNNGSTDLTYSTTVQTGGTWSLDIGTASPTSGTLPADGLPTYAKVTAVATNAYGNSGTAVGQNKPAVTAQVTHDNTPTVTGTWTNIVGDTLSVTLDGTTYSQANSNLTLSGNTWSLTPTSALSDGTHSVTATVSRSGTDKVDVTSSELVVDTVGSVDITSYGGGATASTNDPTPVISGTTTGMPDGTVLTVSLDTDNNGSYDLVYKATVNSSAWSVNTGSATPYSGTFPGSGLAGPVPITATATDPAGNVGNDAQTLTVDVTPPVIAITSNNQTADASPLITGTTDLPPGSIISVTINPGGGDASDAFSYSNVVVQAGGTWSVDTGTSPSSGTRADLSGTTNTVTATGTDADGNTATATGNVAIVANTPAITITEPLDWNNGNSDGTLNATEDDTVIIKGITSDVPDNSLLTLTITDGTTTITDTVTVTGNAWQMSAAINLSALANGSLTVTATYVDDGGNAYADTASVLHDKAGTVAIDSISLDTAILGDFITSDQTLIFQGSASASASVLLTLTNTGTSTQVFQTTVAANASGVWTYDYSGTTLAAGNYSLQAVSGATANQAIVIDTTAPTAPTVASQSSTTDTTPTITGTATVGAGETLTVTVNGVTYSVGDGNLTHSGGNWSLTIPAANALSPAVSGGFNGIYNVVATVRDTAGNATSDNTTDELTIADTTAPVIDLDPSNAGTIHLTVTSTDGAAVSLDDNGDAASLTEASDRLNTLTLAVDGLQNGTNEKLVFGSTTLAANGSDIGSVDVTDISVGGVRVNITYASGVFTLQKYNYADLTAAEAQAVIRDIQYQNSAGASSTAGARTFDFGATDDAGNSATAARSTVTVALSAGDTTPPVITGPSGGAGAAASTDSVAENTSAVHTFSASESVTWSLVGGADQAKFSIDAGGNLSFASAPNFENPLDSGDTAGNNTYVVQVQAEDSAHNTSTQTVTVTVTNVDEVAPAFSSAATGNADENQNQLYDANATDAVDYTNQVVTYSLKAATGDVAALSINSSTGVVTLASGNLDFETKASYGFTVIATDASGNSSEQAVTISLNDLDEVPPVITGPSGSAGDTTSIKTINENTTAVHTFTASETVTWSLVGGEDQAKFTIDANSGALAFQSAPDFESPTDGSTSGSNTYIVQVRATDGAGNTSTQTVTVTVANLDEVPPLNQDAPTPATPEPSPASIQSAAAGMAPPPAEAPSTPQAEIVDVPKPSETSREQARPADLELRVQRDIPLQNFAPAEGPALISFTIPADTFAHTDAQAKISLSAVMLDGSPLPPWLVFDPAKGEFRGIAPEDFDGVIEVRVLARDDKGNQVETMVRIQVRGKSERGLGAGRASLSEQFRAQGIHAWKAERDQLLRHAREAGLKAKAAKAA